MKTLRALALLLPFLAGACQSPMRPADILEEQQRAWNAGELERFVEVGYWRSPELSFYSGGEVRTGYDQTLARFRQSYQAEGKEMGQLAFTDSEVMMLDPVNALVRGRWQLRFADGSTSGGLFTLLMHRMPEGWRIVHDHTSTQEQP